MNFDSKILITGASGLLGSMLIEQLILQGYNSIFTPNRFELDCLNKSSVDLWFKKNKPEYVFHLASLVYGLQGNLDNKIKSLRDNLNIADSVIYACFENSVKKIFYAGTVAAYAYPYKSMPLLEDDFLSGEPHKGEYGYAIAKRYALSLLNLIESSGGSSFNYGIFTNLYGPNDRFNISSGHVIPSLICKAFTAARLREPLQVWGRAETVRDFIYVRDAARAAIHCMKSDLKVVNISSGIGTTLGELVSEILENLQEDISVEWDVSAPIGVEQRVVDNKKLLNSGFELKTSLIQGLYETMNWYKLNEKRLRK